MHDCATVDEELARLREEVAFLRSRLEELEKQAEASKTSKENPVPPWVKRMQRNQRRKKPGAREGHEPHHRDVPEADEEQDATLTDCPECGTELGEPFETRSHTVEDMVPARRKTTRWWIHRYRCRGCGTTAEGRAEGVLPGQHFGLNLMITV